MLLVMGTRPARTWRNCGRFSRRRNGCRWPNGRTPPQGRHDLSLKTRLIKIWQMTPADAERNLSEKEDELVLQTQLAQALAAEPAAGRRQPANNQPQQGNQQQQQRQGQQQQRRRRGGRPDGGAARSAGGGTRRTARTSARQVRSAAS
jgi:hypothetical protein